MRPRQLDVGTIHAFPTSRPCRVSSPASQAQSHIYMEVDPLYSTFTPAQMMVGEPQYLEAGEGGHANSGLVSSTSSQTSSGYSTAPSDRNSGYDCTSGANTGGHLYQCDEYGDMFHHRHACPSQELTKDNRVFNISQNCDSSFKPSSNHRNSQRIKKPELVMNNILLQHSKREVL